MSRHQAGIPRAVIFGCAGTELSAEEQAFFEQSNPLGFILFARNCETPAQVSALVQSLRGAVGRDDAPVLIDQEGGRVQRLGPPHWQAYPPQNVFARIAESDRRLAREAAYTNARLIASDLTALGIDVDCLPLLDVPVKGAHDIIGNRAFGYDPEIVSDLGAAVVAGLKAGGITPIIKHIPGHGRAGSDSHLELPRVDAEADDLRKSDFLPFKSLSDAPWAMTAHIVYEAFDPERAATLSNTVISQVIRGEIGFQGFLVSDDINMKALSGVAGELASQVLDAGCDAVLHCNGVLEEMTSVSAYIPSLSLIAQERFKAGRAQIPEPDVIDAVALRAKLDEMVKEAL